MNDKDKVAFIFDTNFIVQNHDLEAITKKMIENGFCVYITQVAIDERIAQECNKQKEKYDELEKIRKKFIDFVSIEITKKYEDVQRRYKDGMRKKYNGLFGENIIPLNTDSNTFLRVLERAYAKTPPFIRGNSDKGFKDTLMWISIIDYFARNGEAEVVFVTDDNGFLNSASILQQEFNVVTGKSIQIKSNSYYQELISPRLDFKEKGEEKSTVNLVDMRNEIQEIIGALCWDESENCFGEMEWNKTFTTSQPFDILYIEQVFEQLESKIRLHLLEQGISASIIFDIDNRIKEGNAKIPITCLEKTRDLYFTIKSKYPEYIQQFYLAAVNILNQNCEYYFDVSDEGELPF